MDMCIQMCVDHVYRHVLRHLLGSSPGCHSYSPVSIEYCAYEFVYSAVSCDFLRRVPNSSIWPPTRTDDEKPPEAPKLSEIAIGLSISHALRTNE